MLFQDSGAVDEGVEVAVVVWIAQGEVRDKAGFMARTRVMVSSTCYCFSKLSRLAASRGRQFNLRTSRAITSPLTHSHTWHPESTLEPSCTQTHGQTATFFQPWRAFILA